MTHSKQLDERLLPSWFTPDDRWLARRLYDKGHTSFEVTRFEPRPFSELLEMDTIDPARLGPTNHTIALRAKRERT